MTQVEIFKSKLAELEQSKDFEQCFDLLKDLMYKIVDTNQAYRGFDRAIEKYIADKDVRMKIYGDAIQEKMKGDEYTKDEYEFVCSLYPDDDGV